MKIQEYLHLRNDTERFYVSRNGVERGISNIEDGMNATTQGLTENVKKNKVRLPQPTTGISRELSQRQMKKQQWKKSQKTKMVPEKKEIIFFSRQEKIFLFFSLKKWVSWNIASIKILNFNDSSQS